MADKILVFDMDGTIADFYGVKGWLKDLENQMTRPYEIAAPLYNMAVLNELLERLKQIGYKIIVTSWLANHSNEDYKNATRAAKLNWLNAYDFPYDEVHLVQYGTTKANCTRHLGGYQILVDDNEKIRNGWNLGDTIDANGDIIEELRKLL